MGTPRAYLLLPMVVAACAAPADDVEPSAQTRQAIIGGTLSTAARDATVLVNDGSQYGGCTGTLVAPNLVLTARHCVSAFNYDDECGVPLGKTASASVFSVSVGVHATPQRSVARATKIFVPESPANGLCGADVALLLLDKDIPDAQVATVRFTPPAPDEPATAVGYGEGGGRRERGVSVLAVGPRQTTYRTANGATLPMSVPSQDFATGESTCFGDSGGPLFDAQGRLLGVASRGIDDRCEDRPTIWTSLAAHQALLESAARAAGHPLSTAAPGANATPSEGKQVRQAGGNDDDDELGEDDEDDGNDGGPAFTNAGCGVTARPPSSAFAARAWLALGVALVAAARRRRR